MTIPFNCPHCGAHTNVGEEFAGRRGPCFQCGQTITVPDFLGVATAPGIARPRSRPVQADKKTMAVIAVAVVAGLCCVMGVPLVALLLPAVQAAQEAGRKAQCHNNLVHIGIALHNYHQANGCYPPPYLTSASGAPMHSWRVLLLPYLDRQDLYARYNFNEPWNGPNNQLLAAEIPDIYQCPSDAHPPGSVETSYVAIVGPGLFFDPIRTNRFAYIVDGPAGTIAVVESSGPHGLHVPWMAPQDLSAESIAPMINGQAGPGIASKHLHGAQFLMADGHVHFLNDDLAPANLRGMLTIAGGEQVVTFE